MRSMEVFATESANAETTRTELRRGLGAAFATPVAGAKHALSFREQRFYLQLTLCF